MRVNVDRHLDDLLQRGHQLPGCLRAQQPRRVLDDDFVTAHVDQAFGKRAPQLEAVGRGDRVAQRALHPLLRLHGGGDRRLHVAEVVEGVEDAKDIDAVLGRVLDEQLDGVVGEVAVGDEILSANQGLDRRMWRRLVQLAQVCPRIFAAPHLGLKGGAAERFHRDKSERVHLGGNRHDFVAAQVAAKERLLRVAKGGVEQVNPERLLRHYYVARASRFSWWCLATWASVMPMIRAASQAAFLAPASPMATVATGIPAGICTIE